MIEVETRNGKAVFSVRVSPGASRTRVLGEHAGALKISVAAPPEKGKANKAVTDFLASALGVRKADVSVVSGETPKSKLVAVDGLPAKAVQEKLAALL